MNANHQVTQVPEGRPVRMWTEGVAVDPRAEVQLHNVARMPFVHKWVAVMPDVHVGIGATIGTVVPTRGAIIPAAVGVDLGCGMMAVRTSLTASDLPDDLGHVRAAIEQAVPHGRSSGRRSDKGSWSDPAKRVTDAWAGLAERFTTIADKHPKVAQSNNLVHLGTLGTGNHFIELCIAQDQSVWVMLHSGSRGVGNRIGSYFIAMAKQDMKTWFINLPDHNLAYFPEGTEHFDDYIEAVAWAQDFARTNREVMMTATLHALSQARGMPAFQARLQAVNCHHNYVAREHHYGEDVWVTRKGAVRAGEGELGIIPGSMGTRSYIVRGKGNRESFCSCSHGAGRTMSRTEAKRTFTVDDHRKATEGVECRKDAGVIDETPAAYKPIEDVMHAQRDLVEIVHTLRQVVCVKG